METITRIGELIVASRLDPLVNGLLFVIPLGIVALYLLAVSIYALATSLFKDPTRCPKCLRRLVVVAPGPEGMKRPRQSKIYCLRCKTSEWRNNEDCAGIHWAP